MMNTHRHFGTWLCVLTLACAAVHAADADKKDDTPAAEVPARSSGGSGGEAGTFPRLTLDVDGRQREYRLIVPKAVIESKKPTPILFAFHGFLVDSKDVMPRYTKLGELGEKHGFIVVFPNALDRMWQVVDPDPRKPDIAFFDALLADLGKRYDLDLNRVYVTGMSNGAFFANLLASRRSEVIAAIAPHSGGLGMLYFSGIDAKRKYPVMIVHGLDDRLVNIQQARDARDRYVKAGHEVEYVEVEKLGHFWAHRADINERMWRFFETHPMRRQD